VDYPIVFIPGLFGSLGDDVVKGTGEFSFGFAEKVYRPFIEILNSMGYIEDENLFISYYDWKKHVLEAVDKYLYRDIEKIKKDTGYHKVIIIGHSLGGLLARAYMAYFNPSDVDKLIMIGTPNLGSIDAYCFWSGGKLPYSKVEDNILYNGIKGAFTLYYNLYHKTNHIEALRSIFPVAGDLLPSYAYGNYLYWEKEDYRTGISIDKMSIENSFLNNLNHKIINPDKLYIISGSGSQTNMEFMVDLKGEKSIKWEDGKPRKVYKTNDGDGTVTIFSTFGTLGGNSIVLEGNHTDILYKSQNYLSDILEKPILEEVEIDKTEKVHAILASASPELEIVTSDYNEISSKYMDIKDSRVQAVYLGNDNFWIMAAGDKDLDVKINTESTRKAKPGIYENIISL